MLDSFDVMLFALALPVDHAGPRDVDEQPAGLIGSVDAGRSRRRWRGFGWIADRFGRTRALMASVLLYSVFTAACGLAQTFAQFAVFRILLGMGMGGEWASGATLVSESWPAEHRGKALALMQSAWAIGYAARGDRHRAGPAGDGAGGPSSSSAFCPRFSRSGCGAACGSRDIWLARAQEAQRRAASTRCSRGGLAPLTVALTLMNALHAVWLVGFQPLASELSVRSPRPAAALAFRSSSRLHVVFAMQIGMWFGYVTFGFVSDAIGRKRTYVALPAGGGRADCSSTCRSARRWRCSSLGPFVAFFATGYFSGFGAVTAEIFPDRHPRHRAGFHLQRRPLASAAAPFTVGSLAQTHGFSAALSITSLAFLACRGAVDLDSGDEGRQLA